MLSFRFLSSVSVAVPAILCALGGCILNGDSSNHPPVIQSLTADPSSVHPDSTATVSVRATDRDRDPLQYLWEATAGSFPEGAEGQMTAWRAPDSAGVCSVTVVVSDGLDAVRGGLEVPVLEPGETVYTYEIVNVYPHDTGAWTQGLVFDDGFLYEGTGLVGQSSLRKVQLETGSVLQSRELPRPYYGEGITLFGDRFLQLTWRSRVGFVYDRETLDSLGVFFYPTRGWGLTHDGTRLILSDGTSTLYFLDPDTFEIIGDIAVYGEDGPVVRLNELEYVDGEIFANVWLTDRIVRVAPETGRVVGWIELGGLLTPEESGPADVLNGIAWDAEGERLFVTGKLWPWVFEIRLLGGR